MDIKSILDLQSDSVPGGYNKELEETIVRKKRHEVTSALKLPHLISDVENVSVMYQIDEPNFITTNIFSGYLTYMSNDASKVELENKIVLIENADPGFDWIFSHNIGGLITKFGGTNSHMAIRCLSLECRWLW